MSETAASEAQQLMGLDTVRIKSPYMAQNIVDKVKAQGQSYCQVLNETGELLWEVTRTNLKGSYDSRIMVKPMYEDCQKSKSGKPEWHSSPPYLIVECSVPKAMHGQNVYGVIEDLQTACENVRTLLQQLMGIELPHTANWTVQRVDWAESFQLPYQAVQEFFEGIYHVAFPRRKMQKYGNESIFVPGTTTTIKLYHKGPEFQKNDRKRLAWVLTNAFREVAARDAAPDWAQRQAYRKVAAIQRLANNRLRAEVEVHAEELDYDFGHKPKVREITTNYLQAVFDKEITRLLREGSEGVNVVRSSLAVRDRLEARFSPELAGLLHGFWLGLSIDAIAPMHIREYLDIRGQVARVRANREKALFSHVFNKAREWGYTAAQNPCQGVKGFKETGRSRYVTDEEFERVKAHAHYTVADAMDVALLTGQRPADVLKIQRSDVRDGALWIVQNKTGARLGIEVTGELAAVIDRINQRPRKAISAYLIQDENGQPLSQFALRSRFDKARALAKVDFQFRDIRAKAATDTGDLAHSQKLLAHKSRGMTEHYIKARIGEKVRPLR